MEDKIKNYKDQVNRTIRTYKPKVIDVLRKDGNISITPLMSRAGYCVYDSRNTFMLILRELLTEGEIEFDERTCTYSLIEKSKPIRKKAKELGASII